MTEPTVIPEWLATLLGRLMIENEALRRALAEAQATNPDQPEKQPANYGPPHPGQDIYHEGWTCCGAEPT